MSFDRVASIYDATRAVPDGVIARVADCILAATRAGPDTKFLELGIGTGRIALPFIERGYAYTGVDISRRMMDRLRAKVPPDRENLSLLEADVTDLPFPDGSFDVILTVHVLHLVPEWRKALDEARRLLVPYGYFVEAHDGSLPGDPGDEIRRRWRTLVEETGTRLRPDYGTARALEAELTAQGCRTAVYRVAQWEHELRPIDLLEEQRNRVFSLSWDVPDDVLAAVHQKMLGWARERYGDVHRPITAHEEFMVSVSRYPS